MGRRVLRRHYFIPCKRSETLRLYRCENILKFEMHYSGSFIMLLERIADRQAFFSISKRIFLSKEQLPFSKSLSHPIWLKFKSPETVCAKEAGLPRATGCLSDFV